MQSKDPSRRAFLTLPAGAAAWTAAPGLISAQSPNDKVHVALIGVGVRGSFLLEQIMKVPGVEVVAICDTDPTRLAAAIAAAAKSGHTAAPYDDFRKMLDARKDVDAVLIATPTYVHKMMAVAALEVGKHVYAEKPMALTPEECRMVAAAAASAKGIYQAGFQLRHDPARRVAMDFLHAGGMGTVLYAHGYRHSRDLRGAPWYYNRSVSGDSIVEQACHILDLFTWAVDKPPLRVFGSGGVNLFKDVPPGRTTMDNYSVIYEFPDNVRVNFSHIYFDPPAFSGIKERVFCSAGAIDLPTATWTPLEKSPIKLDVPNAGKDASYLSLEAFIDNARNRRRPLNDATSALRSTLMAMMGRKSIYERRVVTWEEMTA